MSKLSEPVAKALQALLKASKGDTSVVMRTLTGNFSAEEYFRSSVDEINLLRCAPFNDILIALVEGLPQAIKTTELPSKAAADKGILTEEELKEIEEYQSKFGHISFQDACKLRTSHRHLLSANAELSFKNMKLQEENKEMSGAIDALQHQMWEGI